MSERLMLAIVMIILCFYLIIAYLNGKKYSIRNYLNGRKPFHIVAKKYVYGWYCMTSGEHSTRMAYVYDGLSDLISPPLSDDVKVSIENYILRRAEKDLNDIINTFNKEE